jgi:ATP-dependent Lon protease
LPWSVSTSDQIDIAKARAILDEDHYDLEKIKDRIVEYLAVGKLKNKLTGPILCFVGPPGVGKTSLGQSIAKAMGRKFVRLSVGGVRDEAEIRGHRRTYIGAMPGTIVRALRDAGTNNPVMMIDEIDKVGGDFRGDPQSRAARGARSGAEQLVPRPLPRPAVRPLARAVHLHREHARLDLERAARPHGDHQPLGLHRAREASDRQALPNPQAEKSQRAQRRSGSICPIPRSSRSSSTTRARPGSAISSARSARSSARSRARSPRSEVRTRVKPENLVDYLSKARFYNEVKRRTATVGVATGLAYTPVGGDILFIETTSMPGSGKFTLTGQLGDVMKESATAAISFLRSRTHELGLPDDYFAKHDLHIHIPAGAVPKDGPSAGVSMATSIASLLTAIKVDPEVAMTGEITLTGQVLPIGGVKEKVLGAKRAGIKKVILPRRNEIDLDEVPKEVRDTMQFVFVDELSEVFAHALGKRIIAPVMLGSAAHNGASNVVALRPSAKRASVRATRNGSRRKRTST